jgi:hypothetical protein
MRNLKIPKANLIHFADIDGVHIPTSLERSIIDMFQHSCTKGKVVHVVQMIFTPSPLLIIRGLKKL